MKIINIIPHFPNYAAFVNYSRPNYNWDTIGDKWVGIMGCDWADLIGIEITKISNNISYEVWQPDDRADKIYQATIAKNVIHKLFPAKYKYNKIVKNHNIYSPILMQALKNELREEKIIIHLNYMNDLLNNTIIENFSDYNILMEYHGEIRLPQRDLYAFSKNPFYYYNKINELIGQKKRFSKIKALIYKNEENISYLRHYVTNCQKISVGINTGFWVKKDKGICRQELGLGKDEIVLLVVTRIIDLKQIDKLILAIDKIDSKKLIKLLIVGNGEENYIKFINGLIDNSKHKNRYTMVGYKVGDELRNLYSAADIFIQPSLTEGNSVSCLEAMSMELAIITSDIGGHYEFLKEEKAGVIILRKSWKTWKNVIEQVISNLETVKIVDREKIINVFDWKNIAVKYTEIYNNIL